MWNAARRRYRKWRRRGPLNFRYLTSRWRALPDMVIAGAMKSGTTSLFAYLSQHPDFLASTCKEIRYFDRYFLRGQAWYRMHFPFAATCRRPRLAGSRRRVVGEATPSYLVHPHVPRRMAELLPEVQVVVILRNPVERAYSHYQGRLRKSAEEMGFSEVIALEPQRLNGEVQRILEDEFRDVTRLMSYSYLARGHYAEQLERLFDSIPRERVLVLESSEFYADAAAVCRRVFEFLGIAPIDVDVSMVRKVGSYREPMPTDVRGRLVDYFAPHNARLEALLGRTFAWS
jgi:hypothetical protein